MKNDSIYVKQEQNQNVVLNLVERFTQSFPEHRLSDDTMRREFAEKILKKGVFIVAYFEEQPVGFVCGYMNDLETKCAYGSALWIADDMGMLRGVVLYRLLDRVVEMAEAHGMERLRGEVAFENEHAYKLYKKLGVTEMGKSSANSAYVELTVEAWNKNKKM